MCRVADYKTWKTIEDEDIDRIAALPAEFRAHTLLPPDPENPAETGTDFTSGVALLVCHCAFRSCSWVSSRSQGSTSRQEAGAAYAVEVHEGDQIAIDVFKQPHPVEADGEALAGLGLVCGTFGRQPVERLLEAASR